MLVKEAGLSLCCGGIFGMGEGMRDRIEFAFALNELNADSIPVNFLMPMPGTPLAGSDILNPLEALKTIALFALSTQQRRSASAGAGGRTERPPVHALCCRRRWHTYWKLFDDAWQKSGKRLRDDKGFGAYCFTGINKRNVFFL